MCLRNDRHNTMLWNIAWKSSIIFMSSLLFCITFFKSILHNTKKRLLGNARREKWGKCMQVVADLCHSIFISPVLSEVKGPTHDKVTVSSRKPLSKHTLDHYALLLIRPLVIWLANLYSWVVYKAFDWTRSRVHLTNKTTRYIYRFIFKN